MHYMNTYPTISRLFSTSSHILLARDPRWSHAADHRLDRNPWFCKMEWIQIFILVQSCYNLRAQIRIYMLVTNSANLPFRDAVNFIHHTIVTITILPEIEGFSSTSLHFQLMRPSTELNKMLTLGQIVLCCEQSFWYTGPSSGSTGSYTAFRLTTWSITREIRGETTRTTLWLPLSMHSNL